MRTSQRKIWWGLKERRFTTTARVLGELAAADIKVTVTDKGSHAAWWEPTTRTIVLNDSMPATSREEQILVWERAKLYHELFHVMFTTHDAERAQFTAKANDSGKYLWISNVLEDGRIEYHGCKLYEGTRWYIRTLLKELVRENSAASGLLLYVRTRLWRNAKEEAFWAPYQSLIEEAITADSSLRVWEIAYEITNRMYKPQPKQPPQPPQEPQGDGQSESEEPTEGTDTEPVSPEDESEEGEEGEDSGETGNESESEEDEEGEEDGEDEEDGGMDESIPSDEPEQTQGGQQSSPSEPPTVDSDEVEEEVREEIENMVEEALNEVEEEVNEELTDLQAELADYEEPQGYADRAEECNAGMLVETFNSVLVESARTRFTPCLRGGMLDSRRYPAVVAGGSCMQRREEKPSQPHIVLCIDESGSMQPIKDKLSAAARVLNGGIAGCGARSAIFGFGDYKAKAYGVVPTEGFECDGADTPTHEALRAALGWLDGEQARHGLVIVVTDGAPTMYGLAMKAFEAVRQAGYFVLNVQVGAAAKAVGAARLRTMCHQWICIDNVGDLVRALEQPLAAFMAGAF